MKTFAAIFVALVGYSAFTCIVAGALGLAKATRLAQATVAALWLPLWLPAVAVWELLLKPAFLAAATLCSGSCKWHPDHMALDQLAEQQAAEALQPIAMLPAEWEVAILRPNQPTEWLRAADGDRYVRQYEDPDAP